MAEYDEAYQQFMKKYRAAPAQQRSAIMRAEMPKTPEYASRLLPLVTAEPQSDEALNALTWIAQRGEGDQISQARMLLLRHHQQADAMPDIAFSMSRETPSSESQTFLQQLIEGCSDEQQRLKGVASYARLMQFQNGQRSWDYLKQQLESFGQDVAEEDARYQRARKSWDAMANSLSEEARTYYETGRLADGRDLADHLEEIGTQYSDVVLMERGDTKIRIGEKCEGTLFELRNLAIGKVVPDITGEDLDGEEFNLSDYRGKVVVLDFWGDW